jgi:hypothetical protein
MSMARQSGGERDGNSQQTKTLCALRDTAARKRARKSVNAILVDYSRSLEQALHMESESFLDRVVSRSGRPD